MKESNHETTPELTNEELLRIYESQERSLTKDEILALLNAGIDPEYLGVFEVPGEETDVEFFKRTFGVCSARKRPRRTRVFGG